GGLDLMVVIGGYNSSNTQALTRICSDRLPTYHVDRSECLQAEAIRHRLIGQAEETRTPSWLREGAVRVGLTAGASTPNSVVGEVIARLLALRGLRSE